MICQGWVGEVHTILTGPIRHLSPMYKMDQLCCKMHGLVAAARLVADVCSNPKKSQVKGALNVTMSFIIHAVMCSH